MYMGYMLYTPHPVFSGDKIEKNEMGAVCSTYGERRGVYRVLWGHLKERDHLEDPGVDGRILII